MMEQVPTTVLSDHPCHLGEGPTYDVTTDTAWWFDIREGLLFEAQLGNGRALAPVTSLHPLPHCLLQHNRRKVLVVRRLRCNGLVFRWCAHKRLAARPERRAAEYGLD